jgi:hypothetical protein
LNLLVLINMYSDKDGMATKQSQAVYDRSIRRLLFVTSLLSWLGFVAAVLNGEYTGNNLHDLVSLDEASFLSLGQFLWASCFSLVSHLITRTNAILSLSFLSTVLRYIGKKALPKLMQQG